MVKYQCYCFLLEEYEGDYLREHRFSLEFSNILYFLFSKYRPGLTSLILLNFLKMYLSFTKQFY